METVFPDTLDIGDAVTRPEVEFQRHLTPSGIPLKLFFENGWYRNGVLGLTPSHPLAKG